MRNRGWLVLALGVLLAVMSFTASCSKKVVQSRVESQPAPMTKPEVQKPEVRKPEVRKAEVREPEVKKAPDSSAEAAGQAARPKEDRQRAEAAAREAAKWVFVNEQVHFSVGSSLLSDEARRILQGKAEYLRANPNVMVTVEGHCDERGTDAYNAALGERRAVSVKSFLVDQGIGTIRLNTASYGEERPIAVGHEEASWARNRRAQFVIN